MKAVNESKSKTGYGGEYDEVLYLKGDYTKSHQAAKYQKENGTFSEYDLLTNNCAQAVVDLLSESEDLWTMVKLALVRAEIYPRLMHEALKLVYCILILMTIHMALGGTTLAEIKYASSVPCGSIPLACDGERLFFLSTEETAFSHLGTLYEIKGDETRQLMQIKGDYFEIGLYDSNMYFSTYKSGGFIDRLLRDVTVYKLTLLQNPEIYCTFNLKYGRERPYDKALKTTLYGPVLIESNINTGKRDFYISNSLTSELMLEGIAENKMDIYDTFACWDGINENNSSILHIYSFCDEQLYTIESGRIIDSFIRGEFRGILYGSTLYFKDKFGVYSYDLLSAKEDSIFYVENCLMFCICNDRLYIPKDGNLISIDLHSPYNSSISYTINKIDHSYFAICDGSCYIFEFNKNKKTEMFQRIDLS